MSGSTLRNLRVVEKLLGLQALQNLVFVTNRWGSQPDPRHVAFEEQLVGDSNYFASAIAEGARAGAKYRIYEGATEGQARGVLSDLFLNSTPVVLTIQRDMIDEKRALRDTEASRIIDDQVEAAKTQLKGFMNEIKQYLQNLSGGKEERKKRILLEHEDAESQFEQAKKQNGILQLTLEMIREHPYLCALVAVVAIGTAGAIVLGSGKIIVVARFACAVKVAASGTATTAALTAAPITGTGTGAGVVSIAVNGNAPAGLVALAAAAVAGRMGLRGFKKGGGTAVPI